MDTIKINITGSMSNTIDDAAWKISQGQLNGKLRHGSEIYFILDSDSVSLSDLYAQARLFSCMLHISEHLKYNVVLMINIKKRSKNDRISSLEKSGFIECLKNERIKIQVDDKLSITSPEQIPFDFLEEAPTGKGFYSWPVLPLCEFPFKAVGADEKAALDETRRILGEIANKALGFIRKGSNAEIQPGNLALEFGHILWGVLKELVLNAIVHSQKRKLYIALTIRRETGQDSRSHRPGIFYTPGTTLWDICVIDQGLGIFPTVSTTLGKKHKNNYFTFEPWPRKQDDHGNDKIEGKYSENKKDRIDNFRAMKEHEETLLSTIFQGNLGVRKGRRSEGLYETCRQLHWSGGDLMLRSGRTGISIKSVYTREAYTKYVEKGPSNHYCYLPGVIFSVALPSRQLRVKKINSQSTPLPLENIQNRNIVIHQLHDLPVGLFGSQADIQVRRTGEILAKRLIEEYCKLELKYAPNGRYLEEKDKPAIFLEVDLKLSTAINADFLNILLQELSKSVPDTHVHKENVLSRIVFTNTRRDIINALKERSCNAFLMIKGQYCLILDEADQPHFLGIPRLTERALDLEDSLINLIEAQCISEKYLEKAFRFTSNQLCALRELLGDSDLNMLYGVEHHGITHFIAHNICGKIKEERRNRLLKKWWKFVRIHDDNGVIRLMNGTYIDRIFDFSSYWAQEDHLIDAAKILLEQCSPVQCVIGFMHNGDRLAASLQQFLGAPQFHILDPIKPDLTDIPFGPGCILVLDAIYSGDDQHGYVHDLLKKRVNSELKSEIGDTEIDSVVSNVVQAVFSFVDFRTDKGSQHSTISTFMGYNLYSVFSPSILLTDNNITDVNTLMTKLEKDINPSTEQISKLIWVNLSTELKQLFCDPKTTLLQRKASLIIELNQFLQDDIIYESLPDKSRFAQKPIGECLIRFNRSVIEDNFPLEIRKNIIDNPISKDIIAGTPTIAVSAEGFLPPLTLMQRTSNASYFEENTITSLISNGSKDKGIDQCLRYSEIELSSDFWHNVSTLKVLTRDQSGREKRNLLFYENNERIIKHYRTRRHLEAFLDEFIQKRLKLGVDVVIHPTHTVGAFLAHRVAATLNMSPLIIPLTQEYGSEIQISGEAYQELQDKLRHLQTSRNRVSLRAVILDDSVLTGKSLFTMLGIADKLGFHVTGVFVVLNRLSPAVSAAMAAMPFNFSYLYRLHMPIMDSGKSPDQILIERANRIRKKTTSVFANNWSSIVLMNKTPYLRRISSDKLQGNLSDVDFSINRDDITTASFERHEIIHIINGLLLHEDESILDFDTKLAIVYNFIEGLCREIVFWKLLTVFIAHGLEQKAMTASLGFVRWTLLVLAFSRHANSPTARIELQTLCEKTVNQILEREDWYIFTELVSDCFLVLSEIGDSSLLTFANKLTTKLGPCLIDRENYNNEHWSKAWEVMSSFAWNIESLFTFNNFSLTENIRSQIVTDIKEAPNEELRILCYELYASFFVVNYVENEISKIDNTLLNKLGIDPSNSMLDLIEQRGESYDYLVYAPGYTCTMGMVLKACDAWGVYVFARELHDKEYQLRTCASKSTPAGLLNISPTFQKDIKVWIKKRMEGGDSQTCPLFFFTKNNDDIDEIFNNNSPDIEWLLGAVLRPSSGTEEYYVILSFDRRPPENDLLLTEYYYCCRTLSLLKDILPQIHEKHAVSARAVSALKVAMKALVHRWKLDPKEPKRRQVATLATILLTSGGISSRMLDVSAQTPIKASVISNKLGEVIDSLRRNVKKATRMLKNGNIQDSSEDLVGSNLLPIAYKNKDWINIIPPTELGYANWDTYLAFNGTVFEFVLIECLRNSIMHRTDPSQVSEDRQSESSDLVDLIHVKWNISAPIQGCKEAFLTLWVDNSCNSNYKSSSGKGLKACEDVASIVNGKFFSKQIRSRDGKWRAKLRLPARLMPLELRIALHSYLDNLKKAD